MDVESVIARRREERDDLIERTSGYVQSLAERMSVFAAAVFGSVARGDFNLWSDVDLLVISDELRGDPLQRAERLDPTPPRVTVVGWTRAEWDDQLERGNPIAVEAIEHGVWLRGSPDLLDEPEVPPDPHAP